MSKLSPPSARPLLPTGLIQRETGDVSELPPPVPPPPADAASASPTGGWDWDRARELAEQWFRPLLEKDGWLALAYLSVGAISAALLFAGMLLFGMMTFGLVFAIVGILLIVPFVSVVEKFAQLEQALAAWAGFEFELRELRPLEGYGPRSALRAVTDPDRWRQVAFLASNVLIAPILLAFGSFPASIVLDVVFGDNLINGPGFTIRTGFQIGALGLLALPLAAFAAGAVPRVAIWFAGLKCQIAAWFLGTDRLAAAQQRVTTLSTQRQDVLDAVAVERRRIERNLHDGVQQQLVAIGLDLGMATNHIEDDPARARELVVSAREKVQGSIGELRQLARGLHPAILEDRGIDAALSAVVSGSPIPISVQVDGDLGLSADVAEMVYFIANEAIANVLKHAEARVASIHVSKVAANVRVTIHDDGVGGVDTSKGSGISGIRARVNAVDGTLMVTSPTGGPTTIVAEVPRRG
jgi:signal transduction histidine kinase